MAALGPYVPFEHWPDGARARIASAYTTKAAAAATRIRERMRTRMCACAKRGDLADDGRCSRCLGRLPPR
jgi:hypothetical protein